ncbi:MAG: hypothetical protein IPJ28_15585 [Betaproteobacteria bacterium]|nr:hypothetical protein [Betaproteobacteria bacterium]
MSRANGASTPSDQVCDCILSDKGHTRILVTSMAEEDVNAITGTPWILVGSDGNSSPLRASPARACRTLASRDAHAGAGRLRAGPAPALTKPCTR